MIRRRTVLALGPLAAAASCVRIATSGPVVPVAPASSRSADQGVEIAPQPPVLGGSPEVILAGFLLAMTSDRPGYPVARQYLTQSASNDWKPESGAVIYDSDNHKPVTTEETAALNAPWLGSLDADGRHTPQVGTYKHDFRMIKVDGQWRIGSPPEGLLLAKYLFDRYFRPVTLYFLNSAGTALAPELVHLPGSTVSPTSALEGLLAGPAPWLRPAVSSAIPADTRSSVASVSVAAGMAEVSLTDQIAGLTDKQRTQVSAQLMWTLNQFPQITAVQITMNGQPWALPGDATGIVRIADVTSFAPISPGSWSKAYAARGPVLGQVDDRRSGQFQTLSSAWGTSEWGDTCGSLAISRDETLAAVVSADRKRLWVGQTTVGAPRRIFSGEGLLRPQITDDGTTWTLAVGPENRTHAVITALGGRPQVSIIADLPPGRPVAFRVSPDLTKMAIVLEQAERSVLGLVRLRDREQKLSPEGWHELPMHASHGLLTAVRDVSWAEAMELAVVGASQADPHHSVHRVRLDGSRVDGLGPSDAEIEIIAISALPRIAGLTALVIGEDATVWRFEDRFRWQLVEKGYTVATLPG